MKILFEFKCDDCGHRQENLVERVVYTTVCDQCGGVSSRLISTPCFTFANGVGTDGGNTLRRPGHIVPGGYGT